MHDALLMHDLGKDRNLLLEGSHGSGLLVVHCFMLQGSQSTKVAEFEVRTLRQIS